ncbi:MAG TPA: serine/threonine-protein kinase [Labilithrix sp.]|jgi:serine/threonine-protein kinase
MTEARVVGRYELFEAFASGGIARVHFGRSRGGGGFSRVVAIKRLHDAYAKDARFRTMLVDEARVAARVRHANVVAMLDVVDDGDEVLLVMEYVAGEALAKLARAARKSGEAVPPAIASAIVASMLDGLHAAHEATDAVGAPLGIVHRDVSPQNVIVGVDGVARILDFGVAKALGRAQATTHGEVKGKAAYMAPEQVRGETLDRRADVFAAGVVLWELLAGKRLFDADSAAASMMRVLEASPEAPSDDDAASAIALRALARDRDARWPTAAAMAEALRAAIAPAAAADVASWAMSLTKEALDARAERVAAVESSAPIRASSPPPSTASAEPSTPNAEPRRRRLAAIIGAGALVVLVASGIAIARRGHSTTTIASASASAEPVESVADPEPEASSATPRATRPTRTRRPAPRRGAHADCSPPYVVDSRGVHVLKPECL